MSVARAIHAVHRATLEPARRALRSAVRDVERAQRTILAGHLGRDAVSAFGRAHGFDRIARAPDPMRAWREQVPVASWDELAPWIDRAVAGERAVLGCSPIRFFERTSGSTGRDKLVPYTDAMLGELRRATGAWLADLHDGIPALRRGRSYWSISPATRARTTTPGGIPIGVEDDADYFGPLARWAIARTMAVPGSVARIGDVERWREATSLALLRARDLALISVWSPTFLTLLARWIEEHLDGLLARLEPGRAREIREGLAREGRFVLEALWPDLALVSCWTEGASASFVPALRTRLARTPIQPKGLLATEGVVTIPMLGGTGGVAAASGHLVELLDLETSRAIGLHEARVGARYSPILTTGAGLHRYHLPDVIRCTGRLGTAPRFVFEARLDRTSDLAGEKLSSPIVEPAIERALEETGVRCEFALLTPLRDPARYALWIDADPHPGLASALDRALRTAHHYDHCRTLGQLGAPEIRPVRDGAATYARVISARGVRLGDVKPSRLDAGTEWDRAFSGGHGRA